MTTTLLPPEAPPDSSEKETEILEAFGKTLAWKEDRITVLIRLEEICRKPPQYPKPQTIAYVEESFRRMGFDQIAELVRKDFPCALQSFNNLMQNRQTEELQLLAEIRARREEKAAAHLRTMSELQDRSS